MKNTKEKIDGRLFLSIIVCIVVADQIAKYIVRLAQPDISIIPGILEIIFVRNTGAGFGIFKGQVLWLILISIAAITLFSYLFYKERIHSTPYALIIGGALGNLIDRVFLGYVVDFIDIGWWPTFNFADSAICIGAALLIYEEIKKTKR
ncbi:signal peptidase II [Candidatus Woesearchaeota archaeon]|nr:signal peptidase II [Candidatus Woesearchaeota archaeon]